MPFLVVLPEHALRASACLPRAEASRRAGLLFLHGSTSKLEALKSNGVGDIERYLDIFYLFRPTDGARLTELYRRFFTAIASHYEHYIRADRNRDNIAFMLHYLGAWALTDKDRVLDYGCGPGLSMGVAHSLKLGCVLVGLDTSPKMRRRARGRGMTTTTIYQLDRLRRAQVAAIFASYVLHFPTATEGLSVAWRALLPGGIFIGNFHKSRGFKEVKSFLLDQGGRLLSVDPAVSDVHGPYLAFRKPKRQ